MRSNKMAYYVTDGAKEFQFHRRAIFQILIPFTLSSPIFKVWRLYLELSLEMCC